jgi:dihydroxyacetone kinase
VCSSDLFGKSLASIKERGCASVGDKTMVDAFEPAVEAMKANAGHGMFKMLERAEQASNKGMESTKGMVAKFGRSKSLMERAIGFQDAGATSVWIIMRSMREFVEK